MKLALCLAGGGVKGAAHIGALKAIEEENIKFEYIAGASSGSIIAALNAVGYNSDEIYNLFKKYCKKIKYVDIKNILKMLIGLITKRKIIIDGLNSGEIIQKIINEACNKKGIRNIEQIKTDLIIPSVDLNTGKIYFFCSCQHRRVYSDNIIYVNDIDIGTAVRASCSYPGVFSPCKYKNKELIDGGIRENIPWKETKENGADKVLCITFESELREKEEKNIIDIISESIDILCHELSNYELTGVDYLLKIRTKKVSLLDTSQIDYLYNLGYEQTKKYLNKIKQSIIHK